MLKRTHLAVGVALALFFLPHVTNKWVFVPVVILASLLPDIDSSYSYLGRNKVFRPLQWIVRHRGVFHSLTLCAVIAVIFSYFIPVLALPFFLGYAMHLFFDSITVDGIQPFWPSGVVITGSIRTGGRIEDGVFLSFLIINILLLIYLFI